ncbi:MAG TPA: methyltransferase domain-containing protein [Myxococcales bacterium]
MARYIHGETDTKETNRLEKQARFLTRWILDGVEAGPGALVLDLACGTGAMVRRLAARLPDAILFGADLSRPQLRAARLRSPWLPLVQSDATALPFRNGAFDVVHWSWLLEHVPRERAVDILREVRRVLAPEGVAWMTEVDNDSLAFWPRIPLAEESFRALWKVQEEGGGDPIIGRKLYGLCRAAGFTDVQVFPTTFHLHHGSPPGYFHGMLEEFAEILDSARESLPDRLKPRADEAAAQVLGIEKDPGASFTYTCFRVRASR